MVNTYDVNKGIIGIKNIVAGVPTAVNGGYKFITTLNKETIALLQENKSLRDLLISHYLNYRISITKFQNSDEYVNLTNEVRQQIVAEKKMFSELTDAKNTAKWGVVDDVFINGKTKDDILNIPKGSRPLPETYLSSSYIQQHLAKFEKEGIVSRIVLKKDFDRYGIGKPDAGKSEFVSTKSEIDEILKLPISEQSKKLSIPIEQLQGGQVLRIDFKLSNKYKVEMPSGNEFGTNELWLPGGELPDGNLEAIIKTEGMIKEVDYTVKTIF